MWKKLTGALRGGDMKEANKEKCAVEEWQRRLRQERASKWLLWEPRFFRCRLSREGFFRLPIGCLERASCR